MAVNSLNIINNLPAHRAKIINILDFNSEKLSVIKIIMIKQMSIMITTHFFWLLMV